MTMPATYLQTFVENVAELPAELRRCFGLMRQLDERAADCQKRLDAAAQAALDAHTAQRTEAPAGKRAKVEPKIQAPETLWDTQMESLYQEIHRLAEEKVALAQQVYDYVDQRIRRLDKDMKAFDSELARERVKLGLPEVDPSVLVAEAEAAAAPRKATRGTRRSQAAAPGAAEVAQALADPSEPTYCFCNRVSFGEMVACDNPDCRVEWFHFECVGLSPDQARPKGKWYCPECAPNMKGAGMQRKKR
ncbi:hypothetical protein WJX73_006091 [Symbiochloris irregularis]|uniref:PHD finger protein ING n=1 Tax=Symbiochloris irregularis TaxID=706552 RepID=A0AAW1NLI6_9CHLO